MKDRGAWMQTFSGAAFHPMDPLEDEVVLVDIAHALAHQCRYAGHVSQFYSVAEHSVYVSRHCPPHYALAGLMHDASEAYLVDVPRPIRSHLKNYAEIEHRLMEVIARKFGFRWPMPDHVREIDNRILLDERNQLMSESPKPKGDGWPDHLEPLGIKIEGWTPTNAKREFMARATQILGWAR